MKKTLFLNLAVLLSLACSQLHAQEKQTLYYDKDGKGLDSKKKSVFYRIVAFDVNKKPVGIVEDYFPNGKIQVRSEAVYIDKLNNNKCIWKGHFLEYDERGSVTIDCNFDDQGRMDGMETKFNADGIKIFEGEYSHGNPTKDYYLVYDKKGNSVKYSYLDHLPMKLSTSDKVIVPMSEGKRVFQDGQAIEYYFLNGISVAVRVSREKLYGDYFEIYITVENGTNQQFDFDPTEITAAYGKEQKNFDAEVLTYDYYIKKVNRKQKWSAAFNSFAESAAATQAGYSASSTNATAQATTANGSVVAVSGQSTTQSYNGANQYAAQQNASNNINNYNNQLYSIKQNISAGYLKVNTVMPSSRLIGFVNVKYESADAIMINIPVNGKVYQFIYQTKS